jgi:iron complex outermembrane recepter protein
VLKEHSRALRALAVALLPALPGLAQGVASPEPSPSPLPYRINEDVVVRAVRADEKAPVSRSELSRDEIERRNQGQEIPFLLQQTPGITLTSDTGTSAGYSYFYIRGIPQTRVNMTLDGVPLNEPEDQALYFVDFGDFTSSLQSVEIQRGVGTSPVGTPSYGGAVSFESLALAEHASAQAELGLGSFDTTRASLGGQSGRFGPGLAAYARGTYKETDGFRQGSGVRQRSVFYGVSRQAERSFFKLFGFAGRERTQLAFLAVEKAVLEEHLRFNPMAPEETDRFGQDFVQAQWARALGASSSLALQAYRTSAGGDYRIWSDAEHTALFQYDLDWRLRGGIATLSHEGGRWKASGGLHANDFDSDHAREIVGAGRDYANRGHKQELSGFGRTSYDLGALELFADAQLRRARFRYEGDLQLGAVAWTFFNPRLGLRWDKSPSFSAFASVGRASREPARSDMLAGEDNASLRYDLSAVTPERVVDVEAGIDVRRRGLRLQANLYAMEFRNEISQTGELSEIGLPLRRNVDRSHRRGLEFDLRWEPTARLRVSGTGNLSANAIGEWRQFYDVYGPDGSSLESTSRVHRDVAPLLTPRATLNLGVDWTPRSDVTAGVRGRYVSTAHLDNTGDPAFTTPACFVLDGSARMELARWITSGQPALRVAATNLLNNDRVWPSGYSYLYLNRDVAGADALAGIPYYYPQATRAVFVSVELRF